MKRKIPKYLLECLRSIQDGDDMKFCLGYLGCNASSYISRLKRMGLAHTVRGYGKVEVWRTKSGWKIIENQATKEKSE